MKRRIRRNEHSGTSLKEVWESFIISQTARGVSEATIKNYHNHLKSISHHIDIEMPMEDLSKRHLEQMIVSMRRAGLAHNSVATYLRVTNTFLRWCQREGLTDVVVPNLKEKDTVKEEMEKRRLEVCFVKAL